jgi:hypothetical protein
VARIELPRIRSPVAEIEQVAHSVQTANYGKIGASLNAPIIRAAEYVPANQAFLQLASARASILPAGFQRDLNRVAGAVSFAGNGLGQIPGLRKGSVGQIAGLALGVGSFAVIGGGEAEEGARIGIEEIPRGVYGAEELTDVGRASGEFLGRSAEQIGAPAARDVSGTVEDLARGAPRASDAAAQGIRDASAGLKTSIIKGLGTGARIAVPIGVSAAALGIAAPYIAGGLETIGYGVGAGVYNVGAGLLGLQGAGSAGAGSSGTASGGTTGTSTTGGILSDITSSPIVLLLIVGVGAYLLVEHERKKPSSSPPSGAAS